MTDLTAALGAEPTATTDPGGYRDAWGIGGTDLSWDGLRLETSEIGPENRTPGWSIFGLRATAATVQGFAVEGPSNIQVGDSTSDIASAVDTSRNPEFDGNIPGELPLDHWTRAGENPDGSGTITDWIVGGTDGGEVTYLYATSFSYGM